MNTECRMCKRVQGFSQYTKCRKCSGYKPKRMCYECYEIKEAVEFYSTYSPCKPCHNKKTRTYARVNVRQTRGYCNNWYQKLKKDPIKYAAYLEQKRTYARLKKELQNAG